jgi:hypothetical protein
MNCSCKIPRGRTNGSRVPKLCAIHKRIALEMIDKCIWWVQYSLDRPDYNAGAKGCASDLLICMKAGRSRVEKGESFNSYSTTMKS